MKVKLNATNYSITNSSPTKLLLIIHLYMLRLSGLEGINYINVVVVSFISTMPEQMSFCVSFGCTQTEINKEIV